MWWRTRRRDDDFGMEIQAHIDLETDRLIDEGLSPDEARATARRAFGNVTRTRERFYESRRLGWLDDLLRDLPYAVRGFIRTPGFTAVAVITLALGIGATTATFSVVSAVLLRSSPYPTADRLVQIVENVPAEESFSGRAMRLPSMNPAEVGWWRDNARTLAELAVTMPETRTLTTPDGTVRATGARVSPALFAMRNVRPLLGRWLVADDAHPDASVVVLGEASWRRYYGAAPDIVNQVILLGGQSHAVVGVMPAIFGPQEFWTPYVNAPADSGAVELVAATALLQDGVSIEAAGAEVNLLGAQLRGLQPPDNARMGDASAGPAAGGPPRFEVVHVTDAEVAAVRPALLLFIIAVAGVLLIVCANVANLLLVRGVGRQREVGIRRALGATRGRLVRQLLTEGLVLSLTGGLVGVGLAYGGVQLVRAGSAIELPRQFRNALGLLGPTVLPRAEESALDPTVLVFAFGLSLATGLVFALAPALRLSHAAHAQGLGATGTRGGESGSGRRRIGRVLAVVQLGLATTLLIGSGLLLHSFVNLSTVRLGFDPGAQIFQLVSPGDYTRTRKVALAYELARRVEGLPGVEAAGFINLSPLTGQNVFRNLYLPPDWEAQRDALGEDDRTVVRGVSPGYLRALGVRLVDGRWLDESDGPGQRPTMLVNRAWVRRFSPESSPVGTTVTFVTTGRVRRPITWEIVGVIEDVRWRMDDGADAPPGAADFPLLGFMDLRQLLSSRNDDLERPSMELDMMIGEPGGVGFAVRALEGAPTLEVLRTVARQVDPALTVDGVTTMGGVVAGLIGRPRFYATVVSLFGGIAALIAAVGIYGVLAYGVTQRTREIGIRTALGARPLQVMGLILWQGVTLVAIGVSTGLAGAVGLTRYLEGMLFGLTPLDAPTYAAVAAVFAAVALTASYVPARRAMKVDPIVALRYE